MAITAALVTALGGGNIDYVPITPDARDFTVTLPPGRWLVQVEVSNASSSNYAVAVGGVRSQIPQTTTALLTRIVSGGTLTGTTIVAGSPVIFTHGIAIRLGD